MRRDSWCPPVQALAKQGPPSPHRSRLHPTLFMSRSVQSMIDAAVVDRCHRQSTYDGGGGLQVRLGLWGKWPVRGDNNLLLCAGAQKPSRQWDYPLPHEGKYDRMALLVSTKRH